MGAFEMVSGRKTAFGRKGFNGDVMSEEIRRVSVLSAAGLQAALSGIRDVRQRAHALCRRLASLEDVDLLRSIKEIRSGALAGALGMRTLYLGLLFLDALNAEIGVRRMSELVEKAREQGDYAIIAILMDLPSEDYELQGPRPLMDLSLKDVPLGVRKSLARRPDPQVVRRMAEDQDHRVIRNLLDNPRLTEIDVGRIASARPASSRVLEVIYHHPKWVTRYSVQKVIVLNPATPPALSLRLLALIRLTDLEETRDSPELHPSLKTMAERTIEEKIRLFRAG